MCLQPLCNIIQETPAKSLLYEAIYTVTLGLPFTARADGSQPKIIPSVVQVRQAVSGGVSGGGRRE